MALWFTNFLKSGMVKLKKQSTQKIVKYNSTETIPVKIFFEILKTENKSLLNPGKIQISQSELDLIWEEILKDYYFKTNSKRYKQLISREKAKWIIRNKLTTCSACLFLLNINDENKKEAIKTLEYFGYKNISSDKIESSLLKDKSKLEILVSQDDKSNTNEEINFWRILSQVENALNRQLDIEKITLAYWIELIKGIKERNLQYGKQGRNTKVRHNI